MRKLYSVVYSMKIRYTMLYSSKLVAVVVYSIYYNNIEAYTIIVYTSLHTIIVYSVYYIVVVVYTISLPSFRCLRVRVYDSGRQMYLYIRVKYNITIYVLKYSFV